MVRSLTFREFKIASSRSLAAVLHSKVLYFKLKKFKILIELPFQLYEKQLKLAGLTGSLSPAGLSRSLALAKSPPALVTSVKKRVVTPAQAAQAGASLLDNCYSKTLIDAHSMKTVDIKEVIFFS